MTDTLDFDAAREEAKGDAPTPFRLFGQDWHADPIADALALDMIGGNGLDQARALRQMMTTLVVEGERDEFNELWRNGRPAVDAVIGDENGEGATSGSSAVRPLSLGEMSTILNGVLEKQMGRPTTP